MKYIYPKKTNIENIKINEIKNKFLITNRSDLNIYGILINLNEIKILKEYNYYIIKLSENNKLEYYDNFLKENINNYKNIVNKRNKYKFIKIKFNSLLNDYYNSKVENITIFINYVKKTGFLNIPIINIL